MPVKASVRKLTNGSSNGVIPTSHQRLQNRAAAVYDASIDCFDLNIVCHLHRLSKETILNDWKGNIDYLKEKLNLSDKNDIKRRFNKILTEVNNDGLHPTLEQAINEKSIKNSMKRFLDDFNPNKKQIIIEEKFSSSNSLLVLINQGTPILTKFEENYILNCLLKIKPQTFSDIEDILYQEINSIININYQIKLTFIDEIWLTTFMINSFDYMWKIDQKWLKLIAESKTNEKKWSKKLIKYISNQNDNDKMKYCTTKKRKNYDKENDDNERKDDQPLAKKMSQY